jgi:DNA uptake protein ComE-like DNA-binding protein
VLFIQKTWLYSGIALLFFGIGGFLLKENRYLLDYVYSPKNIYVKIQGSVMSPGIYEMRQGDILEDLVKKAGGLKENATIPNFDPDQLLLDGQVIQLGDR